MGQATVRISNVTLRSARGAPIPGWCLRIGRCADPRPAEQPSSEICEIKDGPSVLSASVGRRRGFFAELQHQQRLAEHRKRREHAAAVQVHNRAVREAERAQREYERAVAAAQRAAALDQALANAEAKGAHVRAQRATAELHTAQAIDAFEQIDSLLAATLDVDDYVDIDSLKQGVQHPPFPREDLKTPLPEPVLEQSPPEPTFVAPAAPTGVSKLFNKQKHAEAQAKAHSAWVAQHERWAHHANHVLPARNAKLLEDHAAAEQQRAELLTAALAEYRSDRAKRERDVAEANEKLENLKMSLAAGDPEAINEYVGIVLGNSAYPEVFQVDYEFEFDAELGELTVVVIVPPPSAIPNVKAYKYVAASDEIRETPCSQKEQRERYNGAVAAVAIRTFHEVFESDREGRIQTVSLTMQTETVNPATGLVEAFPLVAAAADRQEFSQYDLRNVDPAQTLAHMRSQVSKNAFGLKPISTARGIR
jgi:restriction system protein